MTCCPTIIQTFANESTTTVPFTGAKPTVTVSYLVDGVWIAIGVATNIKISDTQVVVDHGGPATGLVKLILE